MIDFLVTILPILFYGGALVLMIWALFDISARKMANKSLWVVVIIGLPIIGSLGYLIGARHGK